MHHKGINKHHYEYWQDNFDNGGVALEMPIKYKKEMICDYIGAGKAYYGKDFTIQKEYEWWLNKKSKPLAMHEKDKEFLNTFFKLYMSCGEKVAFGLLKRVKKEKHYEIITDYYKSLTK